MKIRKLSVINFRCLLKFEIAFDNALTLVVGENDAGKTSLIDCLKVITQNRTVTVDDFSYGQDQLEISLEIEDFVFKKMYQIQQGVVRQSSFKAYPSRDYIERTRGILEDLAFDPETEKSRNFVREVAIQLGMAPRANINIQNLKGQVVELLSVEEDLVIEDAVFPKFNNILLDGKHFENVPAFFKEVFLKEKQANIWQVEVGNGATLESFVKSNLEEYSDDVSRQIQELGITNKLKIFLRDLTEVKVEPIFHPRDLNIDAKVKFLENGEEINIENKGDGTKRRITMALLEFKHEQTRIPEDNGTVYLLDEPDTHLHVNAQLELIETVMGFGAVGHQVILTTHSPFIVNAVKPGQVRLLCQIDRATSVKRLHSDPEFSEKLLRAIGIENTHLFFSRVLVIVEGATEENFLHAQYLKRTGQTLSSGLIKVMNVDGVQNIHGFASAIQELHDPERIFTLCDNDASLELRALIAALMVPVANKFLVGTREFEDAFSSVVLHQCWVNYLQECDREIPELWTSDTIEQLKVECLANQFKFSKKLRSLNAGGKSMTKPIFGTALGTHTEGRDLPQELNDLLTSLMTQ